MTSHNAILCRLCHRLTNRPALTLSGMPRFNHRLLQEHEVESDAPVDMLVHRCDACGFVSLRAELACDYYDNYVNAPSSSPQVQAFLGEQAQVLVERFGLQGLTVLEIGCGDGGFLAKLLQAGAYARGIEPSRAQRDIALAQGLDVVDGLLTADRVLEGGPFDAFATRQVFEHVEDLHGFLAAIRAHLKSDGVGLVEVPNLDTLLAQDRFFDFIPEHVNYFSSRTLRLVLEMAGFEVVAIDPVQGGEALRALVRNLPPLALDGLTRRIEPLRVEIAHFIDWRRALGERVAVWGAGGKGINLLAITALRGIDLLVDADPHKEGRYTPASHLRVHRPEALRDHRIDAVVILAPAYRNEILHALREKHGFEGAIGVVGDTFEVIEPVRNASAGRCC